MTSHSSDVTSDEFDDLDALASRMRAPRPVARRVLRHTADGAVSGIAWGVGDPRYVFLHGGGLNAHSWDTVITVLAEPALALDLPGHGESDWRSDADYRADPMAATIAQAVPDVDPLIIVGHSLGGLTAMALSARLNRPPAALVLVDMSPGVVSSRLPPAGIFMGGLTFDSREHAAHWAMQQGWGSDMNRLLRGIRHNTRVRDDGRVEFRHHLARLSLEEQHVDDDPERFWSALNPSVPTLLVRGTRGVIDSAQRALVIDRAPWVAIVDLETGHNVHSQAAPELARLISLFAASALSSRRDEPYRSG